MKPEPAGLQAPRRYWALVGLWSGMAMSVLDASVANIALPSIARTFAAVPSDAVWVVTAYQIAIVMTLLPCAALGERYGYLRVYGVGLALFVAASLACAVAPDLVVLAALRFVQGLGAAGMMAVNGALMRHVWPRPLLSRGIGYNATVIACTAAAGPGVAGLLLRAADWRWLFLINMPIGLVAGWLSLRHGPRAPRETDHFDVLDSVLCVATFGSAFLAISALAHGQWSPLWGVVGLAATAAGALLARRLRTRARPIVPLDLLRFPILRDAYAASIAAFAAQMCLLVALPFALEDRHGLAASQVGLLILPLPIGVGIASPLAGRFADRVWAAKMGASGLLLMATAMVVIAFLVARPPAPVMLVPCMALAGAGFGLFQAPNNTVMLRTGPLARAGAAAGALAQCRLLGQTAGALIAIGSLHLQGHPPAVAIGCGAGLAVLASVPTAWRSAPTSPG